MAAYTRRSTVFSQNPADVRKNNEHRRLFVNSAALDFQVTQQQKTLQRGNTVCRHVCVVDTSIQHTAFHKMRFTRKEKGYEIYDSERQGTYVIYAKLFEGVLFEDLYTTAHNESTLMLF